MIAIGLNEFHHTYPWILEWEQGYFVTIILGYFVLSSIFLYNVRNENDSNLLFPYSNQKSIVTFKTQQKMDSFHR